MENIENKKPNKKSPCLEKNCSECCDPVKISFRKGYNPDNIPIPKNEEGEDIWKQKDEFWVPEKNIDTVRVQPYDCNNLDKETGLCKDYENRPDICRNSSCLSENSSKTVDEQHKEHIEMKFIKIKRK